MNESSKKAQRLNLSVDYRWLSLALLAIIVAMLAVWRPWSQAAGTADDQTIEVTGQTTVSAEPDEFVFYPTYEFKSADEAVAIELMAAKSTELLAGLKKLGVASKDIKTNSDSWSYQTVKPEGEDATTYTLRLTVTTASDELTQKVQDYLVSTTPTGTISPQATFSEAKRKELEAKGRDEASKDARAKADQSAKNLGFKIVSVKHVNDGSGFGGVYPLMERSIALDSNAASSSLPVQPGENELTYTVTVTYYIK